MKNGHWVQKRRSQKHYDLVTLERSVSQNTSPNTCWWVKSCPKMKHPKSRLSNRPKFFTSPPKNKNETIRFTPQSFQKKTTAPRQTHPLPPLLPTSPSGDSSEPPRRPRPPAAPPRPRQRLHRGLESFAVGQTAGNRALLGCGSLGGALFFCFGVRGVVFLWLVGFFKNCGVVYFVGSFWCLFGSCPVLFRY